VPDPPWTNVMVPVTRPLAKVPVKVPAIGAVPIDAVTVPLPPASSPVAVPLKGRESVMGGSGQFADDRNVTVAVPVTVLPVWRNVAVMSDRKTPHCGSVGPTMPSPFATSPVHVVLFCGVVPPTVTTTSLLAPPTWLPTRVTTRT